MTSRTLIGLLVLFPLSCAASDALRRVTVRDRDFSVVRSIERDDELRRFGAIWSTREASTQELRPDFELIVDIDGGPSSGRWHYSTSGLCRVLSVKQSTSFEVPDPAALNALLGVD